MTRHRPTSSPYSEIASYCSSKLCFFCLFVVLNPFTGSTQTFKPLVFEGKPDFYINLDANYSKIINRPVAFSGLGIGADWESGVGLALSYYRLSSRVLVNRYSSSGDFSRIRMHYIALSLSQQVFKYEDLLLSAELLAGIGNIVAENVLPQINRGLFCLEPALRAKYSITEWLYLYGTLGYRLSFTAKEFSFSDFSSSKIDLGISISPVSLYKAIRNGQFTSENE